MNNRKLTNGRRPNETLLMTALAILIGLPVVRAAPQTEKGDAGDDFATAELLDAKIDKWTGEHSGANDCDLICFYWPGGTLTCRAEPLSLDMDTGIMLFAADGTCLGEVDENVEEAETLSVSDLPPGIYYLYGGWYDANAYDTEANYDTHLSLNAYCFPGIGGRGGPHVPPSGSLYKCDVGHSDPAPIGGRYRICFIGSTHVGIPFLADATSGPSKAKAEKKGNNKYNAGAGQIYGFKTTGRKGKAFVACRNESANSGAANLQLRGVSRRLFRSKYVDVTKGTNVTAALKRSDYCQNFVAGEKRIVKIILVPKGIARKKPKVKETAKLNCNSGGGLHRDTSGVEFGFDNS